MEPRRGYGWATLLVVTVLAMVAACTTSSAPAQDKADKSPARRLQTALKALVADDQGPPGAIVLVQRGQRLRTFTAGTANVESGRALRPDMQMRVASTAKAYSGAVALALVEQGDLALDDTVGLRLPWAPKAWRNVTLRQALHHTSGLPDFSVSEDFRTYLLDHLEEAPPPRRLLEFVADAPLEFRPGSRYQYSNSDNVVVALMVEHATGRPYEKVLATEVLRPLNLDRTSLPSGVRLGRPRIEGYDREDDGSLVNVTELIAAGYAWASGGIVSTPADQNRFIRGYVGRRLFDRPTQRQQFDFRHGHSEPPGPGRNTAGLAVFRYRTRCGTVFGHTGNTPGYTQFMAASKNGRRSVVVAVNRQTNPDVAPEVFRQLREVFELAVCAVRSR